jgi:hypothetical protein
MKLHSWIVIACSLSLLAARPTLAQNVAPGQLSTATRQKRVESRGTPLQSQRDASSAIMLTGIAEVQEEIGLTAEQSQQLDAAEKAAAEKQRDLLAEFQKRSAELKQTAEAEALALLNEKQRMRLAQLHLQTRGASALVSPDVAEKLGLTADQRDKLARLPRGIFTGERLYTEMTAVLTDEQRKTWDRMVGAKFEFPAARRLSAPHSSELGIRSRRFIIGRIKADQPGPVSTVAAARTVLGPASPFLYQAVLDELKLSDEQKSKIQAIGTDDAEAIGTIDPNVDTDIAAKVEAIDITTQEKVDKVLTDDQRRKLKELLSW